MNQALVLCHVSFEGPGQLVPLLQSHGVEIHQVDWWRGQKPSKLLGHNPTTLPRLIVVMGGPMGTKDVLDYPWLLEEKLYLQDAVSLGIPILGICLGAQLLAEVLGGRVYANHTKEIGWYPLFEGDHKSQRVFHWHGDTFDLPRSATLLASSELCKNQAFVVDGRYLGLQFHLECGPSELATMVQAGQEELVPALGIQDGPTILRAQDIDFAMLHQTLHTLLGKLLGGQAITSLGFMNNGR